MKINRNKIQSLAIYSLLLGTVGCTDLEDKVQDRSVGIKSGGGAALNSVYAQLNPLTDQANVYALLEHPSDEMMGPTRGTDWDDFGTWRKLHQHTWDATHNQITDSWDILNIGVYRATQVIAAAGSDKNTEAQARFLRAFFMFYLVDLYGQIPYREANESFENPPKVLNRVQATDFILQDLNTALPNLAPGAPDNAGLASKEAASFLLAKVYLNRAVYTQDPQQPAGPFNFAADDMNKVIEHCNAILSSSAYQLEPSGQYFDNFHWENTTLSKELIFAIKNERGAPVGNAQNRYRMSLHYYQTPDGWNGFTTLADFYNSFEAGDQRLGGPYPGVTDQLGLNVGFLAGQQKDKNGQPLKERGGKPLVFTPTLNLLYAGEAEGIRVVKYLPEPGNFNNQGTDYIFFRLADAVLMKAEAIHRGGTDPQGATAAQLVNQVRKARGLADMATVTDQDLLKERGHELYWEGWRRNDQIRFGTFLNPMDQKPQQSPPHVVVFPIPQRALSSNPNLKQNFGYSN